MKHSKIRFSAIVALLLVFCMLLSSCSVLDKLLGKEPPENDPGDIDNNDKNNGTNDKPGNNDNTPTVCSHAQTGLVGKKNPTCTEKGYTGDAVCLACTQIVTKGSEINALDHSYDTGKITKDPTCAETGVKTYTCTGCGTITTETVDMVAHSDSYINAWDGTHFHECRKCTLSENEEHNPIDEGIIYPASCLEAAYVELTCADCGAKYKVYDETQPALKHDFGDWKETKSATCKAGGLKTQTCQRDGCGYTLKIELPKTEKCVMVFDSYITAPTCNADGEALYVCKDCGKEETRAVSATGVHGYEVQEDKGDGWTHKVCSSCGDTISSFDASSQISADLTAGSIDKTQALEMDMEKATIQFPTNVVGQIAADESKDVSISADEAEPEKKNEAIEKIADESIKEAIANATVYDFTVTVGDEIFTDNFSTKVAITMYYDGSVEDAEGIVIYYLANNGTIETITDVVYDPVNSTVTFYVEHFSFYAVAFRETQEMRCRRGVHIDVATADTVAASCHSFGYTVYECSCCHRKTVDNITERLPHIYGDIIEAKPTCTSGDYSHQICQNEGCGEVLLIQFKGATGHKIDAPATCTTPSTCTKCQNVVYRALGHNWSEWEIVVKPTEVTNGLRRRNCSICGIFEEITLAATGNIDTITYNSYSELINLIFDKVLKLNSGSIDFELTESDGNKYIISIKVMKDENGYTLLMSEPGYFNNGVEENATIYYRNGVFVADIPGVGVQSSDIDHLSNIPIDIFKAVLEDIHAELNYYVEEYLKSARLLFEEYSPIVSAELDAVLAAAGSEFTVAEIENLIDSIETVYAYMSLKLGYATNAEIIEGITLPEISDFEAIVSAFTTLTEGEDGSKTYTYDLTKIIDAFNAVIDWFEEKSAETVAEFVYGLIGEKLLETNEDLVDFDAFIEWLREELPGTLTVADGIDKLLMVLEDNEIITLDSVYNLIDELAYKITGNNFNSRTYVASNGTATLNDFAGMMLGSPEVTLDMLYDMICEMANETYVGDFAITPDMNVSAIVGMAKDMIGSVQLVGGLTFVFDKDGNFVSFELDEDFRMATGTDEETEETIYESFEKATVSIVRDDSLVIELPKRLSDAILNVKTSYDEEGNLIIEGIDDSYDVSFYANGSGDFDLDEILKVDEKLSAELGFTVYVIDEKFWDDGKQSSEYYVIDGKCYTGKYVSKLVSSAEVTVSLSALASDPMSFLPEDGSEPDGYVENYMDGSLIPAWNIGVGVVYQEDGEWMFAISQGYYELENGGVVYSAYNAITYTEFAANVRISSVNNSFSDRYDEDTVKILNVNYYVDASGETMSSSCIIKDNEIFLIDSESYEYEGYYELTEIGALPDEDGYIVDEYTRKIQISDGNGGLKQVNARVYEYWIPVPVYFVKIADGLYSELNNYAISYGEDNKLPGHISNGIYAGAYETVELPDGNTLYIKGRDQKPDKNGYTAIYGYAKTADGLYIQTVCRVDGDSIVSIEYRETYGTYSAFYNSMYDVKDYLTKLADGKYKISKTLLDEMQKYCTESDSGCYIRVFAEKTVDGTEYSHGYSFGCYYVKPEVSLGDILGGFGGAQSAEDYWGRYFGNYGSYNDYQFKLNEDGSLTIYFENGKVISNVNYSFGNRLPADTDKLVKDESRDWNGLDVYKLELFKDATYEERFVYKDGKYYRFNTPANYRFDYVLAPFNSYYISSMSYQFDTVPAEGLEGGVPVYNTTIAFRDHIWNLGGICSINVYTFVIDGEIYVAKQAIQTGESLLQFESYVKLEDYMNSLEFVLYQDMSNATYSTLYCEGVYTTVGVEVYNVYETDENGDILENGLGSIWCYYVVKDGVKNYIYDSSSISNVIELYDEYVIPAGKYYDISYSTSTYYNGDVTIAICRYTEKATAVQYFVKLAGKYYRYDGHGSCYCDKFYGYHGCYWCASIDEDTFKYHNYDKVWYYQLIDRDGNLLGYYTEFEVSDAGFVPKNQTYDVIEGEMINSILLGYTEDGYALYEVAFYVESAAGKDYTVEQQPDGTVFYHVDGTGYLKDQSGRYIPARKMLNANGEYEIVCRIYSAYVNDGYLDYPGVLDLFVDYKIGNSYITISRELLEVAKNNRNAFYIRLNIKNYGEVYIDYDILDALFSGKMNNDNNYEDDMEDSGDYPYDGPILDNPGKDDGGENTSTPDKEYDKDLV